MISKLTPKALMLITSKIVLGLIVIGFSQSVKAQTACNHVTLNYNVNQFYYALGISNTRLEESTWYVEIFDANYQLDETQFSSPNGIQLTIETTSNSDGSFNHTITPDQPIDSYQYLSFVYNGVPPNTTNDYSANTSITCSFDYDALAENLEFNYFNEAQYSFGFSVQNNNSTEYLQYEVFIDNATYLIDPDQLNHNGFDFINVDNDDGTYDYYFLSQDPIQAFSSSPNVSSNQNLGTNVMSDAKIIRGGNNIVSSGFNGGLESHGGLSSKIALRNFKRALGINSGPILKIDNTIISDFAPKHILVGDELIEASPSDLIEITAAETIWAGDYYINGNRFASVFGSKTSEEVYDHTKVICDRVKGSELLSVETVNIDGHETIMSTIRRPDNMIEHAISFSLAYKDFGDFTMASNWVVDEYPSSPNFLNYQVWTNSKAKSIAAVKHIIKSVVTENGYSLQAAPNSPRIPKLFARRAHYKMGAFYLELNNLLSETTTLEVSGNFTSKEVEGQKFPFYREIEIIPGQTSLKLDLPFGNIFDGEISLKSEENQKDLIYLADGSWGLEYDDVVTDVDKMEIIAEERIENDEEYLVERGISVSGLTDDYISIFKQLVPGGLAMDLSDYNTMSFDSEREGVYEVTLLTDGNTVPNLNFSHTLKTEAESSVDIPFALFSNALGEPLDASKITTIYIAFKKANNDQGNFDFSIKNIVFKNIESSALNINPDLHQNKLHLYPNPSTGTVQFTHFFTEKTEAVITVYDTKGTIVKQLNNTAYEGLQNFQIQFDNKEQGIYLVSLFTNDGIYSNVLLLR